MSLSKRLRTLASYEGMSVAYCLRDGAALAATAGVALLEALDEELPDEICGVSSGSIVGGALAAGVSVPDIRRAIGGIDIWKIGWDLSLWRRFRGGAWFDLRVVDAWLRSWIPVRNFSDFRLPIHLLASRRLKPAEKGRRFAAHVFNHATAGDLDPIQAILASMAIDGVFDPPEIKGERYADGANTSFRPWATVAKYSARQRLVMVVLTSVYRSSWSVGGWRPHAMWENPTAKAVGPEPFRYGKAGHLVVPVNVEWGAEHPLNFRDTMRRCDTFRATLESQLDSALTHLEQTGMASVG